MQGNQPIYSPRYVKENRLNHKLSIGHGRIWLVMAVFLVCYIPMLVSGWAVTNGFDTKMDLPWISTFFYASSTANPCTYCLRNPRLSPIIMSYVNRCFCRRGRVTQGRNRQEDATSDAT